MTGPRDWFDGMRARVAVTLLVALLLQFVGGEIIFGRIEAAQMAQARAGYLSDHLTIAGKLIGDDADPQTMELMNRLWRDRLAVAVLPGEPLPPAMPETEELAFIRERIAEAYPGLADEDLHLSRERDTLEGTLRLDDGTWLRFRSEDYFRANSMVLHYASSVALLLICVVLIALLFGRMIGRPLHLLVEAAEKVDRDEPVSVAVGGPREVRQVAGAFEAMQTRLLSHLRERVQSLAAMSHDLRTPLTRLRLNASMVKDAEVRAALEADVDEMEAFVASVLDYLRGDEAEAEQRTDIASILMTVVDEACDLGGNVRYVGPARLEVVTRPLKLKRIVRNIVENAGNHADEVTVALLDTPSEVVIAVDDNGPGIAEADLEVVFEPFKRLDASRSRRTGGAGLGLAIAKRLVTRLGGTIALRNRPEGGLNVKICFPRRASVESGSQH